MKAQGLTLDTYTEDMRTAEREKGDNATVSLVCSFHSTKADYRLPFSSSATLSKPPA